MQENRRYRGNKKHIVRITESQLRNAIGNVVNGIINLKSDKNKKIAILLMSGYSLTEISKIIGISVSSVHYRVNNSLKKELVREEFLIG